jgi:Tfp pilus assembly protein PilN
MANQATPPCSHNLLYTALQCRLPASVMLLLVLVLVLVLVVAAVVVLPKPWAATSQQNHQGLEHQQQDLG